MEVQLPGHHDFDQHYTTGRQVQFLPNYEYSEQQRRLHIEDPVWGSETIGDWEGDELFGELFLHPTFQRLAAIEQLTLPRVYATMPGSTELTRWEHAWGSVVFVRKMIRQAEAEGRTFDPRQKMVLQLRTLVSDAAHTAFSHLGDWLRQGFGGTEDSHDEDLTDYLENTGVNDVLRNSRFGIQPEEVIFPPVEDWVECSSPALCVDRVDYGVREIMRWVDPGVNEVWRNAFRIDEQDRLVMKDEATARYFGLCFGMLATEHWSHPVHRLQLQLFGDIVKGAILDVPPVVRGYPMHVIDRLYTVDNDVIANIRATGTLNNDLHALLLDIARAQRRVFAWGREKSVDHFAQYHRPPGLSYKPELLTYPHPLVEDTHFLAYTGVAPQNIELLPVQHAEALDDFGKLPHTLDLFLPAFKPRAIDPPFTDAEGRVRRVGEVDDSYGEYLDTIRRIQSQPYVARIYMAPPAKARLQGKLLEVQAEWDDAMRQERTPDSRENLVKILQSIGFMAIGSSPNTINLVY